MKKRIIGIILAISLVLSTGVSGLAKTSASAKGENIFFYAASSEGAVLLKIIPLSELKKLAHGQNGKNYYISSTDNYPTTQYCEARGITVPELVDYVKSVTSVAGADKINFSGGDRIYLMATDSFGNYNRNWTYDELYGVTRYYFEGMFNTKTGWNTGWEIAGEDSSKFGVSLSDYNAKYKDSDPFYEAKRAVFATGVETVPILATESFSGRTTSSALVASTEIGIAEEIAKNGGIAAGSLKDMLEDTWSLRLALPMTEADLMAAHRTAFDNFKWIYNLRLDMENTPALKALGNVSEPVADVKISGDTLTIAITCDTPGATIYYSHDGAPQIPYTKPLTLDVKGRNLASDPVTFYMTAVREGYTDAGVITAKYPGLAPAFAALYSAMSGEDVVFPARDGVNADTWSDWADNLTFITLKTPDSNGYVRIDAGKWESSGKAITLDASLFTEPGPYSLVFHAAGFADKSASLTVKKSAPSVISPATSKLGMPLMFRFSDTDYQDGVSLFITPPDGEISAVSANWLDRTRSGRVTLKAAYFEAPSCVITQPGAYIFSFSNSRYEPGTVEIPLEIWQADIPAFSDVNTEHWYYDAVRFVMGAGLFDAQNAGEFGAGKLTTRLMLAEALYRLENSPAATENSPFSDSTAMSVIWANSAGIVNGNGDGTFAPNAGITREQIAVMLHRYAVYKKLDVSAKGDLSVFVDGGSVSDWAKDALAWANAAGFINGLGNGTVSPQGMATREQVAQILLNFAG